MKKVLSCNPPVESSPRRPRARRASLLDQGEALFRAVLDASPDDITVSDLDGVIRIASPSAVRLFGYEREDEIISRSIFEGLAPEEWTRARNQLRKVYDGSGTSLNQYAAVRRDGSRFYIEVNTALIQPENDGILGYVFIVRDVTQRTALELELKRHHDHLQTLVDQRTAAIKRGNDALRDMNATLRVLLAQRDKDRLRLEKRMLTNIETLVFRLINSLRQSALDEHQSAYVDAIERHLRDICSPFMSNLSDFHFTPRELQVASLIRVGKTSKEIGRMLNIAVTSVGVHRKSIRAKLGLRGGRTNLQVRLGQLAGASGPDVPRSDPVR